MDDLREGFELLVARTGLICLLMFLLSLAVLIGAHLYYVHIGIINDVQRLDAVQPPIPWLMPTRKIGLMGAAGCGIWFFGRILWNFVLWFCITWGGGRIWLGRPRYWYGPRD